MAKGDDIEERLIDFAVRIIRVCDELPDRHAGKHIRGQLLRCGTSPAPNYGEARGAESGKDFVHKLKVVLIDSCLAENHYSGRDAAGKATR